MRPSLGTISHPIEAVRASLYARARAFAHRTQTQKLLKELGLKTKNGDLETLQTLATVKAHLCESVRTVIDVGAHVGAFAEPAMRILGADELICFEPCPTVHPLLRRRISPFSHRIVDCALDKHPGNGTLKVHSDRSMSSLLESDTATLATHFNTYDHHSIERVAVRVSTLDAEVLPLAVATPFFLKLDTQGTELRILEAGRETLSRTAGVLIEHMFTTPYVNATRFSDLISFMDLASFTCVAVTDLKRKPSNRVSGVDFLFCRDEKSFVSCAGT